MPWTETTRLQHDRRSLRYASDCTDSEWALIKPFMPARSKVGRLVCPSGVAHMRYSIEQTVKQANGQTVLRTMKAKELRMKPEEPEALLGELIARQEGKCALTGLPFDFSLSGDKQRRPSLDRIDSDGHYEAGNIQIVCRFINFWKGATPNDEFERLLQLVQGIDGGA